MPDLVPRNSPSGSDCESDTDSGIGILPLSKSSGVGTKCPPPMFEKKAEITASAASGFDLSNIELAWSEQPSEYHRARYPKELSKRGNCRGAIEGRHRGVPTIQLRGLLGQPNCPDEVDLTVYVSLPDGRRHPYFYCLTAGRDAPSSCQAFCLADDTKALRLKARAEDNFVCQLKHVGIVRLRQEVNDADKLGINNSDSMPAQDSPRPPLSDSSGSKSRSTKGKHDSLPSYNNYFRLCVMANIVGADGTYFHSMSESVKCVSSTQLVQNPHITEILCTAQSLIVEGPEGGRKPAAQPELYVFGKDFASNTRFRVFRRLPDGRVWRSTFAAKDFNWLCGHHCCVKVTLPTPPQEIQQAANSVVHMEVVIHSEKSPCSDIPLDWDSSTRFTYPAGPWPRSFVESELISEVNTLSRSKRITHRYPKAVKRSRPATGVVDEGDAPPNKKHTKGRTSSGPIVSASSVSQPSASTPQGAAPSATPQKPQTDRSQGQQRRPVATTKKQQPVLNDCLPPAISVQQAEEQEAWNRLLQQSAVISQPGTLRSGGCLDNLLTASAHAWSMPSQGLSPSTGCLPVEQHRMTLEDHLLQQGFSGSSYDPQQCGQFPSLKGAFGLPSPSSSSASFSCPESPESAFNLDASLDFGMCQSQPVPDILSSALSPLSDSGASCGSMASLQLQDQACSNKATIDFSSLRASGTLDDFQMSCDLTMMGLLQPTGVSLAQEVASRPFSLQDICASSSTLPSNQATLIRGSF